MRLVMLQRVSGGDVAVNPEVVECVYQTVPDPVNGGPCCAVGFHERTLEVRGALDDIVGKLRP